IDFDNVNFSNINRQIPALLSTVGQSKCQIMAARIADINPDCHLEYKIVCLDEENISEIVGQGDFLLDAIDSLGAKAALIKYCLDNEIEVFSSMGTGNKLAPEMLQVADISQTKICPLARSLRRRLRSLGIEKGFQVVYSEEIPIVPKRDSENERAVGSCIFVPATAGLLLASLAIRQLVQKNSL
ncbi:MAG: ThiF family adenylyltransferase, partial [Clostridiales bacterium]